ncbi:hypothetical protein DXG01_004558 [Tephrocybe rancida]|nr:hypothetical protein DXG01_004558 [Tephrocybe rancida]
MGRRAKYSTLSETHKANQDQRQRYAQTTRCKELRKAQNNRAYCKKQTLSTAAATVPSTLQLPTLSLELLELAEFRMPTSRIFSLAMESSGAFEGSNFDDSVLADWDSPPPHRLLPPDVNIDKFRDALLGYRMRRQKEMEVERLRRYESEPLRDFATEVHAELMDCHAQWEGLRRDLEKYHKGGNDRVLGLGLLEWMARRICHLENDFHSLRRGLDQFLGVFVDRWSKIY